MNALKSLEKRSRREREVVNAKSKVAIDTTKFFMKAVAVSLHEIYGFGEKRCERIIQDVAQKFSENFNRYSGECVETAMDARLRDYNITVDIKFEED